MYFPSATKIKDNAIFHFMVKAIKLDNYNELE